MDLNKQHKQFLDMLKGFIAQIEAGDIILHGARLDQKENVQDVYGWRGNHELLCVGPTEVEIVLHVTKSAPPPKGLWAWAEDEQVEQVDWDGWDDPQDDD